MVLFLSGIIMGGVLVGVLKAKHHYREIEIFFRGRVAGKDVVGISYFDFHGLRFFESNQWKIELRDPYRESLIIYQSRPVFQESIPHQPKIEIKDRQILIGDGENNLTIEVNK